MVDAPGNVVLYVMRLDNGKFMVSPAVSLEDIPEETFKAMFEATRDWFVRFAHRRFPGRVQSQDVAQQLASDMGQPRRGVRKLL